MNDFGPEAETGRAELDDGADQAGHREDTDATAAFGADLEDLGRRLVEKRARVRIFGVERERRADVVVLNGFSAHADQRDLLTYSGKCREEGPVKQVVLVHGDPKPQQILAGMLGDKGFKKVANPAPKARLAID